MDDQEKARILISEGKNLFITGSGGVGKSYLIDQIIDDSTMVCAPTGIAALNVGGVTCHRAFALPIGIPTPKDYKICPRKVADMFRSSGPVKRLIIDEAGMLRADYLDLINKRLQLARNSQLPFGGIQVILVGDFFQLEPIVSHSESLIFYSLYDSGFAFDSHSWDFPMVELKKVYRQDDKTQVNILNEIRKKGQHWVKALEAIVHHAKPYDDTSNMLHLCCYKEDAKKVNMRWYNQIEEEEFSYYAIVKGKWKEPEYPAEDTLRLKKGARVLITANCPDGSYVNGDRGIISHLSASMITVLKDDGDDVIVNPNKWEKHEYTATKEGLKRDTVADFKQFPIQLGWAVTVHKSQGMTLDNVALDVGNGCFGHGQLYVALSRVKDLKNLSFVRPINYTDLIVRDEVRHFYARAPLAHSPLIDAMAEAS